MMDKNEIIAILETVVTPIYQIEENLGMPKTTLQKAIKGQRVLPKKWALKLLEAYQPKKQTEFIIPKQPSNNAKLIAEHSKKNLSIVLNRQNELEPKEGTSRFFLKYGAFTHEEAKKLKEK